MSLYDMIMSLPDERTFTADDWRALGSGEWEGTEEELQEMLALGYEAIA